MASTEPKGRSEGDPELSEHDRQTRFGRYRVGDAGEGDPPADVQASLSAYTELT